MKTIKAHELSRLKMAAGNEKKYRYVIDNGILKDWVGIGWVDIREVTEKDYEKYPTVKRD
jgi:hypothetical protein